MTESEYFKDWYTVIPTKELNLVVNKVKNLYATTKCIPLYMDIFKTFTIINRRDYA